MTSAQSGVAVHISQRLASTSALEEGEPGLEGFFDEIDTEGADGG
jgi:hypothetical protein